MKRINMNIKTKSQVMSLNQSTKACKDWTEQECKVLLEQHEQGMSLQDIAKFHNVSIRTAYRGLYGLASEPSESHKKELVKYAIENTFEGWNHKDKLVKNLEEYVDNMFHSNITKST